MHTNTSLVSYWFGLSLCVCLSLLALTEKRERERKGKRAGDTNSDKRYESYRLHRLLSFSRTNVFYLVSLILEKKNSFPLDVLFFFFFPSLMILGQHISIIYILYNTVETSQLLSTKIITCGRYSIAINTNYLSCLCKTCT